MTKRPDLTLRNLINNPANKKCLDPVERFWSHVSIGKPDECWEWTAHKDKAGYGVFSLAHHRPEPSKTVLAHRYAYFLAHGVYPPEDTDHLCCNRGCVNPKHLEATSHKENYNRSTQKEVAVRQNEDKTHCKNGHPFNEENTYYRKDHPNWRMCRSCNRERQLQRRLIKNG